jgi:hypothetical protein
LASSDTPEQVQDLKNIEFHLRIVQADDALEEVRCYRRVVTGIYQFKRINLSGDGNKKNTCAHDLMAHYVQKAKNFMEWYHAAYAALNIIDPDGEWATRLKELRDDDIRGPGRDDDEPSEGR